MAENPELGSLQDTEVFIQQVAVGSMGAVI